MEEVHLAILLLTALVIVYADHLGFRYFRGTVRVLDAGRITLLHRIVWVGLLSMILTGVSLAYDRIDYLLSQPVFLLKMGFVLVLIINAGFISALSRLASTVPFSELGARQKTALLVSGALSTISWVGAATIGLFFL